MKRLILSSGPYLWPMLLALLTIGILTLVSLFRLSRRPYQPKEQDEADINAILFWGVIVAVLGFLGQWNGVYRALTAMAKHGLRSWAVLWVGIAETCLTAITGLAILLVAAVIWFGLRSSHRRLVEAARPDSLAGDRVVLQRAAGWTRPIWEWFILILMLLWVLPLAGSVILREGFLARTSVFSWAVIGVAGLALALTAAKVPALYLRDEQEPQRLRWGLPTLLFLATASLGLGVFGLVTELYLMARRIVADADGIILHSARGIFASTSLLILSMVVAILVAIAWFLLDSKVKRTLRSLEPAPGQP